MHHAPLPPCGLLALLWLAPAAAAQEPEPAGNEDAAPPAPASAAATAWPSFRGRHARGVADGFATPAAFDVVEGKNVRWKTPIPGLAHSSPIVWGDRVFVTTAVRDGEAELKVGLYGSIEPVEDEGAHRFDVLCLDLESGEILWAKTAWEGVPAVKRHPKGSHAASTPATDGERVVAFFGSEGLYAYGMDGEPLWDQSFGVLDAGFYMVPTAQWGFGSSPVIEAGRVYVQCDVQGESFVAALDAKTGEEIWRTSRDEVPTWGTPTVDVEGGRRRLLVNGYKHMGGYDLDTGEELWSLAGGGDIPVPTPVVAHDLVFLTNAHGRLSPIIAVAADASGELSLDAEESEHVAWSIRRGGNYMQTPLVYGDELYCCRDNGVLTCLDARTGEEHYQQRLGTGYTGFTASGVAADGKLYFTSEQGEVYAVKAGKTFEQLAMSELGETCMATPAVSAGVLLFRTRHQLIAVAAAE